MKQLDNLLNMTNGEIREYFRKEIFEKEPDSEFKRRLEEYRDNIERDFQEEWSKKRFKWFFKKRRQKKLRAKIARCYTAPVFWLIEEVIEDTLPKVIDENFQKFVDIKDFTLGDKAYFTEEKKND